VYAELVLSWILRDSDRMQVLLTWLDLEWYPTQLKDCVRYAPALGVTMHLFWLSSGTFCLRVACVSRCLMSRAGKSYTTVYGSIQEYTVFYTIMRCFTRFFTPISILYNRIVAFQNPIFGQPYSRVFGFHTLLPK
jgi:hypothetical protein